MVCPRGESPHGTPQRSDLIGSVCVAALPRRPSLDQAGVSQPADPDGLLGGRHRRLGSLDKPTVSRPTHGRGTGQGWECVRIPRDRPRSWTAGHWLWPSRRARTRNPGSKRLLCSVFCHWTGPERTRSVRFGQPAEPFADTSGFGLPWSTIQFVNPRSEGNLSDPVPTGSGLPG